MKKDPDFKIKLQAAMKRFPDEDLDTLFDPADVENQINDPAAFMKELKKFAIENKKFLKDRRSTLEILREIRSVRKW